MTSIDRTDMKILTLLLDDSSQSLSRIGKKINLSRENVHYRVQNLIKKGIIRNFITHMDYVRLGFIQRTVFVEFDKINEEDEVRIIKYLENIPYISWIGTLAGKLSLTFDIYARSEIELDSVVSKFISHFKASIGNYHVFNVVDSRYYFNKLVNNYQSHEHKKKPDNLVRVDKVDKIILKKLNENSRTAYVDIAQSLNVTPNGIRQRVKMLEERGIIEGYSLSVNHRALGFEWYGIQVKLNKPHLEVETMLKDFVSKNKKAVFYYQYSKSGVCDFDIGIAVHNSAELREFINDLRSSFYNELKIIDVFLVLEEKSSHTLPTAVFS